MVTTEKPNATNASEQPWSGRRDCDRLRRDRGTPPSSLGSEQPWSGRRDCDLGAGLFEARETERRNGRNSPGQDGGIATAMLGAYCSDGSTTSSERPSGRRCGGSIPALQRDCRKAPWARQAPAWQRSLRPRRPAGRSPKRPGWSLASPGNLVGTGVVRTEGLRRFASATLKSTTGVLVGTALVRTGGGRP